MQVYKTGNLECIRLTIWINRLIIFNPILETNATAVILMDIMVK